MKQSFYSFITTTSDVQNDIVNDSETEDMAIRSIATTTRSIVVSNSPANLVGATSEILTRSQDDMLSDLVRMDSSNYQGTTTHDSIQSSSHEIAAEESSRQQLSPQPQSTANLQLTLMGKFFLFICGKSS